MLSSQELKELALPIPYRGAAALICDWLVLYALFFIVANSNSVLILGLAFILVARYQHALFMLMHEASHNSLFSSKRLSRYVGQFMLAGALWFSFAAYRDNHLDHHHSPVAGKKMYPMRRSGLLLRMFKDILGLSYLRIISMFVFRPRGRKAERDRFRQGQADLARKEDKPGHPEKGDARNVGIKGGERYFSKAWVFASFIFTNMPIFLLFSLYDKAVYYLYFWILPMVTLLTLFARVRGICEHGGFESSKDQASITRTIINPVEAFFFHPHEANYHIEHHLYPQIPFYRLPAIHRMLVERNALPQRNVFKSYGQIIWNELTY